MNNWPTMVIGDLILPTEQRDPREKPTEEFVYVDIAGIDNEAKTITAPKRILGADAPRRARKVMRQGDVIISTVRPNLNAVAIVPESLDNQICSTGFSVLRPSEKVTSGYLFAFARSSFFTNYLVAKTTGANYPAVSDGEVKRMPISVPPLPEQHQIVKLLDEADALRKLRTQADRRATHLFPALFREMFGDLATNGAGWELVELIEVMSKEKHSIKRGPFGGAIKKEIFVPDGFKIYEQKNAIRNDFTIGTYFIDGAKFKELESFSISPDDLIVSCSGTIGRVAIVPSGARPGIINQALLKLRLNKSRALPIFFKHLLETDHMQTLIFGGAAGSAIKNVMPLSGIKKTRFPLPPLDLQKKFGERVSEIRGLEAEQAASRKQLDALFQSLLHNSFNGVS